MGYQPCPFGTSVFDTISRPIRGANESQPCRHYDRRLTSLHEHDGNLHLSDAAQVPSYTETPGASSSTSVPMGRARSFPRLGSVPCPTTVVDNNTSLRKPFVSLAVVGIVLDTTREHVLMTRRPDYMRSFPGAWVFPGGGVDPHESLSQAVSREILEETGLDIDVVANHDEGQHQHLTPWNVESVWESVYPTQVQQEGYSMLAHHIVVYMSAQLLHEQELHLCQEEVDAATWLSRENVRKILTYSGASATIHNSEGDSTSSISSATTSHIHMQSSASSQDERTKIPLRELSGIYPNDNKMLGLAQGSLFALEEFCKSTWGIRDEPNYQSMES